VIADDTAYDPFEDMPEPAPAEPDYRPADLTFRQAALLDHLLDLARDPEAPSAKEAGQALIRLTSIAFDAPLPEPVEREGGIIGALFGNPIPRRREGDRPEPRIIEVEPDPEPEP
jgi:hypothetical protein